MSTSRAVSPRVAFLAALLISIAAVVIRHSHIDHSGRVALLVKQGYTGPVYTHEASKTLCEIMLPDSGYLDEKEAEWENKKRGRKGKGPVTPLYTREDAESSIDQIHGIEYNTPTIVVPGVTLTLFDAGHILGSSIVQLEYDGKDGKRTLVFSGDLGYRDAPLMDPTTRLDHADAVLMESTYGNRNHRPITETIGQLADVFKSARAAQGNVLIPAFTVGRTSQDTSRRSRSELSRSRYSVPVTFRNTPW